MFHNSDLKTVKKILSYCYLGDWWVLYQLGRNSNTHFFRYLLRHIEQDFTLKERRAAQKEQRSRHRLRPQAQAQNLNGNGSEDSENEDDINGSGSATEIQNGSSRRRHHHKIAMAYNAWSKYPINWCLFYKNSTWGPPMAVKARPAALSSLRSLFRGFAPFLPASAPFVRTAR